MSDGWGALLAEIVKIVLQPKSPGLPPVPGPTPPTPRSPVVLPKRLPVSVRLKKDNEFVERVRDFPQYGDVIFCARVGGLYRHFGIYIGDRCVIHFADPQGDFNTDRAVIHEISLDKFVDGCKLYRMTFPKKYSSDSILRELVMSEDYVLYTPDETVKRAKSKLGKKGVKDDGYNLVMNNCEDFAIWCKTGVFESKQVNAWIDGSILP